MPDLGTTEQIVVNKLSRDLEKLHNELHTLHEFVRLLQKEDLEEFVVDPLVKPVLSTIVEFIESLAEKIGETNMAASVIGMVLMLRETRNKE